MTTRYDQVADHPLTGVPREVLIVARAAVRSVHERERVDPSTPDELIEHVADSVVMSLHEEGFVTWPGRVPDREALVLAVMSAQAWQSNEDGRSVSEYLVDTVVLPLLHGVVGPTSGARVRDRTVSNQITGNVTGSVVQTGRYGGDVTLG